MRLSESYRPVRVDTPLIYIVARRGDMPEDGRRAYWEAMSSNPMDYPPFDCDHFQVLNRENISRLAVLFA